MLPLSILQLQPQLRTLHHLYRALMRHHKSHPETCVILSISELLKLPHMEQSCQSPCKGVTAQLPASNGVYKLLTRLSMADRWSGLSLTAPLPSFSTLHDICHTVNFTRPQCTFTLHSTRRAECQIQGGLSACIRQLDLGRLPTA